MIWITYITPIKGSSDYYCSSIILYHKAPMRDNIRGLCDLNLPSKEVTVMFKNVRVNITAAICSSNTLIVDSQLLEYLVKEEIKNSSRANKELIQERREDIVLQTYPYESIV